MSSRSVDVVVTTAKGERRQRIHAGTVMYPAGFTPTMGALVQDVSSRLYGRYHIRQVVLPDVYEITASNWFVGGKGRGICIGGVRDDAPIFVEHFNGHVKLMALVNDSLFQQEEQKELCRDLSSPLMLPWYCGSNQYGTPVRIYVNRKACGEHELEENIPRHKQELSEAKPLGVSKDQFEAAEPAFVSRDQCETKMSLVSIKSPSRSKTIRLNLVYRNSPEDPLLSEWIELSSSLSINQLKFRIRRKLETVASHSTIRAKHVSPLPTPPITRQHKRQFDAWQSPPLTRTQKQKRYFKDENREQEAILYSPFQTQTPSKSRKLGIKMESEEQFFTPQSSLKEDSDTSRDQIEKMETFLRQLNLMKCFEEFASQETETPSQTVAENCTSMCQEILRRETRGCGNS